MSDCANIEMRERLPDLLHDTLAVSVRLRLEEHIGSCSECAAELEVLRMVRAVEHGRRIPAIDTRSIVAALPRGRRARGRVSVTSRPLWRLAAAVTFVALGGLSLAVVRQYFGGPGLADTLAVSGLPGMAPQTARVGRAAAVSGVTRAGHLTAGGGVADLSDEDLERLIGALDRIEAAPHADPDTSAFGRFVSGSTGGN